MRSSYAPRVTLARHGRVAAEDPACAPAMIREVVGFAVIAFIHAFVLTPFAGLVCPSGSNRSDAFFVQVSVEEAVTTIISACSVVIAATVAASIVEPAWDVDIAAGISSVEFCTIPSVPATLCSIVFATTAYATADPSWVIDMAVGVSSVEFQAVPSVPPALGGVVFASMALPIANFVRVIRCGATVRVLSCKAFQLGNRNIRHAVPAIKPARNRISFGPFVALAIAQAVGVVNVAVGPIGIEAVPSVPPTLQGIILAAVTEIIPYVIGITDFTVGILSIEF
mmetsp:Transcript_8432/g.23624  ORF Transcript_8432/g.23624 Transcript_8432/m.23624 type:complete len:282 (-) Transcript_8432:1067-1912(-)